MSTVETRFVVQGTYRPPVIHYGRSVSLSHYGTIDEALVAVKLCLEAGRHVEVIIDPPPKMPQ